MDEVFPRSGPTTGSPLGIEVRGSGFTDNPYAACYIAGIKYHPTEMDWNFMKCPMPAYEGKVDSFITVSLEVTMNGYDFKKFPRGFQYYEQIEVDDIEPTSGPVSGNSVINAYGKRFRNDNELLFLSCKIGDYLGSAELIRQDEVLCTTPDLSQEKKSIQKKLSNVSIALNG